MVLKIEPKYHRYSSLHHEACCLKRTPLPSSQPLFLAVWFPSEHENKLFTRLHPSLPTGRLHDSPRWWPGVGMVNQLWGDQIPAELASPDILSEPLTKSPNFLKFACRYLAPHLPLCLPCLHLLVVWSLPSEQVHTCQGEMPPQCSTLPTKSQHSECRTRELAVVAHPEQVSKQGPWGVLSWCL